MTELTISLEEIRSAISSYVSSLETGTSREEVGTVADTGDGFNATFATARVIAGAADATLGPDPEFAGRGAQADLLVFGGDEVYPVASAPAYEERLNEVLRAATRMARVRHSPPVVALPGNHDWYDGLAAFRRNFCESWVSRGHDHDASATPRVTVGRDTPAAAATRAIPPRPNERASAPSSKRL